MCVQPDDKKYSDEKSKTKDVIFCGNPGVGKSTLLSSITGVTFKSGVSWAEGLTRELQWKKSNMLPGFRFADTPGLADVKLAKMAATAITKALTLSHTKNNEVLLFFIVSDNAGRIRTEDLFSIRTIMDSIGVKGEKKDNLYSVIVNQMEVLEMPGWKEEGEPMWKSKFSQRSPMVPYPTCRITFLPKVDELVNKSNGSYNFKGLTEFILACPPLKITSLKEIELAKMKEQMEKLRQAQAEERKKLERKMELEKKKRERERQETLRRQREHRARMERELRRREERQREYEAEQRHKRELALQMARVERQRQLEREQDEMRRARERERQLELQLERQRRYSSSSEGGCTIC